jgi:hypothetical protein
MTKAQYESGVATEDPLDHQRSTFSSSEQKVQEVVAKQAAMVDELRSRRRRSAAVQDVRPDLIPVSSQELLEEAYVRCGEVCAEYAKTFYLGTVHIFSLSLSLFLHLRRSHAFVTSLSACGSALVAETFLYTQFLHSV